MPCYRDKLNTHESEEVNLGSKAPQEALDPDSSDGDRRTTCAPGGGMPVFANRGSSSAHGTAGTTARGDDHQPL